MSPYSATAGLHFDDADLESRLVWIWGSPRSGSTWLLEQLSYPLAPDPREPVGFRASTRIDAPVDVVPVDELFLANHIAPAFGDPREVGGTYVPGTLNNYLGRKPVYLLSEEYEKVWRPELRRFALVRLESFLKRAESERVELAPAPLLAIKEVNGSHAADLVMSLLPRSRAILLARDGRDVVDSLLHAYRPGGFLARNQGREFGTPEEREEGLEWAAKLWTCNIDITLKAFESHSAELRRTIRYEDLLADPANELAAVFDWLGLERSADWMGRMVQERSFGAKRGGKYGPLERNRAAKPGLWRENLSAREQEIATEIMGERLVALGYDA